MGRVKKRLSISKSVFRRKLAFTSANELRNWVKRRNRLFSVLPKKLPSSKHVMWVKDRNQGGIALVDCGVFTDMNGKDKYRIIYRIAAGFEPIRNSAKLVFFENTFVQVHCVERLSLTNQRFMDVWLQGVIEHLNAKHPQTGLVVKKLAYRVFSEYVMRMKDFF
jgi:hypothetical protein